MRTGHWCGGWGVTRAGSTVECRQVATEGELWVGGVKMGWTHQQGHNVNKGLRRGGTFIAMKEDWRAEMHKVRTDSRGPGGEGM